jgi:hypothetical protein
MNNKVLAKEFLTECIEAFAVIILFQVLSDKQLDTKSLFRSLKISVLIGGLATVMFALDEDSHGKIKDGMKTSIGASIIGSALRR